MECEFEERRLHCVFREIEKLKKGKKKKKNNENTANEEDYDDEILDENVSSVKTEQIQHISGNVDFNNFVL